MDQVRVPDEWPRKKKIKFISAILITMILILVISVN